MESVYCTVLTKSRLYQFLALLVSLEKVRPQKYRVFALCVDNETYSLLKKLNWKSVTVFQDLELDETVLSIKKERKIHEYCWTLKAIFLEFILNKYPTIMRVTYMDSDLYFWEDPELIFKAQPNCSVLLSREEKSKPEWKPAFIKMVTKLTGEYNSGFISFKRDEMGSSCLRWWREKTVGACRIDFKNGIFGDQKYLDEMPKLFSSTCDITTAGVNIGPWNYRKYTFSENNGHVFINQSPLIFYHFSGVRVIQRENEVELVHESQEHMPFVYTTYQKLLNNLNKLVKHVEPEFNGFADGEDLKSYF